MIMITAPVPDEVRAAVAKAIKARDAAIVEGPNDDWDRKVIDQAIESMAAVGNRFSINDIRPLLPEVRKALLMGAFQRACKRDRLRPVDYTPSTLESTHAAKVTVYEPIPTEAELAARPAPAAKKAKPKPSPDIVDPGMDSLLGQLQDVGA